MLVFPDAMCLVNNPLLGISILILLVREVAHFVQLNALFLKKTVVAKTLVTLLFLRLLSCSQFSELLRDLVLVEIVEEFIFFLFFIIVLKNALVN